MLFIHQKVKLQLPNLQKHPSANTSILLFFPKNHRQLLSLIHFVIVSFINNQIHWLSTSPWLERKRNQNGRSSTGSLNCSTAAPASNCCPSLNQPKISLSSDLGSWFHSPPSAALPSAPATASYRITRFRFHINLHINLWFQVQENTTAPFANI